MSARLLVLLLVSTFGVLSGCGGGGGGGSTAAAPVAPTTLSGTAAAGAPIAGIVTVRDSSSPVKEISAPVDSFGKYTVDVSGMSAPFVLRVTGKVGNTSYNLHSAATQADVGGTVNITPLTDLVLSNVAGQIAANLYNSGNFSAVTAANISNAQSALQAKLQPVLAELGLAATIDFLRLSFNADHTGMDKLLDALKVDVTTASATIKNIINNSQIVDNFAGADPAGTLSGTGTKAGLSEFDQIVAQFDVFGNLFATSLPSMTNPNLTALFDSTNFLMEGQTLNQFLTEITTDPTNVGVKFTNVMIESIDTSAYPYTALVRVEAVQGGLRTDFGMRLGKASASAKWLLQGDGRVGYAWVGANATLMNPACNDGYPNPRSGLLLDVDAPGDANVDYAIVKGNGLPAGGVLLFDQKVGNAFKIATGTYNGTATLGLVCGHHTYFMNDATIAQVVDNGLYTFELWDDANTPTMSDDVKLHTYTQKLAKAPLLNTQLSTANFATITANNFSSIVSTGGTLNVSWTLPPNMLSDGIFAYRGYLSNVPQDNWDVFGSATTTSASTTISPASGTVAYHGLNVWIEDVYGREFVTQINN